MQLFVLPRPHGGGVLLCTDQLQLLLHLCLLRCLHPSMYANATQQFLVVHFQTPQAQRHISILPCRALATEAGTYQEVADQPCSVACK